MVAGRQRSFCKTQALENAMRVFWKKGYAGASLTDLTTAMGINKPSLYSAYGNKEQLFIAAVEYYIEEHAKPLTNVLHESGSLKERISNYLLHVIDGQCRGETVTICGGDVPSGCFISSTISESESDDFPEQARDVVYKMRDFSEHYLTDFLATEQSEGNLANDVDVKAMAQFLVTIMHGTAAMARGGKTKDELISTINTTLNVLA